MKLTPIALALAACPLVAAALLTAAPASAAMPVFDATNYAQNLLQAARALDQINNQVRSLQNEAGMLEAMTRNLRTIDFPQLDRIRSAMQRIDGLMSEAQAIDFRVEGLDRKVRGLFPGSLSRSLNSNTRVTEARARLDAATGAYRQAMRVQAQVAENVREDAGLLAELSAGSQSAAGSLQAQQAANQLLALSVKQQLQLQQLLAADVRGAAIDRARRAQAEEEGRAATRRFLGGERAAGN